MPHWNARATPGGTLHGSGTVASPIPNAFVTVGIASSNGSPA